MCSIGYRSPDQIIAVLFAMDPKIYMKSIREAFLDSEATDFTIKHRGYLSYSKIARDLELPEASFLIAFAFWNSTSDSVVKNHYEVLMRLITFKLDLERHREHFHPDANIETELFESRDNWVINYPRYNEWKVERLSSFRESERRAASFYIRLLNVCLLYTSPSPRDS